MLTFLNGKRQTAIAWFFLIIFYVDIIGAAFASNRVYYSPTPCTNYRSSSSTNNYTDYKDEIPQIEARLVSKNDEIKKVKAIPNFTNNILSNVSLKKATIEAVPEKVDTAGPGPGQPEMSTFKSVGADNMVNLFTGDFSYNIPLLDVDGYPINIFYNAGPTMDQEASWVGLGWNINPGTINRNMRGLPDDFDGSDKVKKEMSMKPDITIGVSGVSSRELLGIPKGADTIKMRKGISKLSPSVYYNSKRGLGFAVTVGADQYATRKSIAKEGQTELVASDTVKFVKGLGSLSLDSKTGLTPSIPFQKSLKLTEKKGKLGISTSIDFNSRTGLGDLRLSTELSGYKKFINSMGTRSTEISFSRSAYTPSIRMPINSFNATFTAKFGKENNIKFKFKSISGYYTKSAISRRYREVEKPAYGYMYYEKANADKNALLDFNRLNDGSFTKKTPIISLPVYTYDVFSISGEGTGGSFRGYRGNMGYMRDPYTRTSSGKLNLEVELGLKKIFHGGTVIGGVYSRSFVQNWDKENNFKDQAQFQSSYKDVESGFYFKNPGEKAIIDEEYYNNMGGDKLMRLTMSASIGINNSLPFLKPKTTLSSRFQLYDGKDETLNKIDINATTSYRKERDKRTQVISFLTAYDADYVGFDKYIKSFPENQFNLRDCPANEAEEKAKDFFKNDIIRRVPYGSEGTLLAYHKKNHISEITVQEASKRYIYGLPVYELGQKDVTMSIEQRVPNLFGQIAYEDPLYTGNPETNSRNNKEGKDGLFQKESIDPFPHSFLLTAILSPDYSDITGNGISDDDLGTAIKFNYSRVGNSKYTSDNPGSNSWTNMAWRLPATVDKYTANYNRGLVTDDQDDKAIYTKGEKELWYTHSIESKNMVATFTVSNRNDGWGVNNEEFSNGGIFTGNGAPCLKKLDKIDLYSKADIVKYGIANAKPIKTVHFTYTYKLCGGYSMFNGDASKGNGKLTLESIYFTYNKNNHQKSKYLFKYADEANTDKNYNPTEYDRWGTYKSHLNNPGSPSAASNEDYPYTNRNKTISDNFSAAWSLNKILLPSGAKIDITYEADDYAYVQNKRAAEMTKILGFGLFHTSVPDANYLYSRTVPHAPWVFNNTDYRYVFFDAPVPVKNNAEQIRNLYLQDLKQLLLKLYVKVPGGTFFGQPGYEPIFVYCDIDSIGVVPSSLNSSTQLYNKFYVKIGKAKRNSGSQIMETVYQFLRDQLPGKAYPGYDVKKSSGVGQVVKSLYGMVNNIRTGVTGFENNARWDGWCKEINAEISGARLSNPYLKKLGGGHRVKTVVITDNWKKMTKPGVANAPEIDSYYGQEYGYTKTEIVNGQPQEISSGVASYEPGVGNEENPFREILQYGKHNVLAPTDFSNIEMPIAETFFPSSSVGYSRVTVKSIHSKNKAIPAENKNIKSGVGMQETEFFTTKDFPTISEYTGFGPRSRHNFNPKPIAKLFNFASKSYMTLTQGFRVLLNDMNGKVKNQASYSEVDLKMPINSTTYHYRMNKTGEGKYKLDNVVPTVSGPDGKIVNKLVGKDIEVMNDLREHFSHTRALQVPLNVEFFKKGTLPLLIPTIYRAVFRDESLFRSATTLKVVNEYGILDSVENFDKGSLVGTKNLVYNAETGDVMVSRTQNEFNKPIYNFSYPAYWALPEMGPAYKNIDATFKGLTFRHGKIDVGLSPDDVNKYFVSGDEIYVIDKATAPLYENPACAAACNSASVLGKSSEYRIWALDITKDDRNTTKEFIFIDRDGNPYNAGNADIRIIRSGRRNMMDAAVGSITSMESPIKLVPNTTTYDKIEISNATDVVNSGAMEFKEKWKVQDAFNVVRTPIVVVRRAPIVPLRLFPEESINIAFKTFNSNINNLPVQSSINLSVNNRTFVRNLVDGTDPGGTKRNYRDREREWIRFNLSGINPNTIVANAFLSLFSHNQNHPNVHNPNSPHAATQVMNTNYFSVSRYLRPSWPVNGLDWWATSITNNGLSGNNNIVVRPAPTMSGGSYARQGNIDNRINVGAMVNSMLISNRDPNPNRRFITAFRLNILQENYNVYNFTQRLCFNNYFGDTREGMRPMLELGIVRCDSAYNSVSNPNPEPTNPPPPNGVGTCTETTIATTCVSIFDGNFINPYVRGLLGNWRPLKSYVYFGERREQDPTVVTNISKDGIIKDFVPFWALDVANNKQITKTNSAKWTWNSEITQYNRKGAELENKDPLERYNASIYGYNEALPIAVVNNSKLRQSAFDGFEDYNFEDISCPVPCNPNKRHFETGIIKGRLETKYAHTGKFSYKTFGSTFGNDNFTNIRIDISGENNAINSSTPDIRLAVTNTITNSNLIVTNGNGLTGAYQSRTYTATRIDEQINFSYSNGNISSMPPANATGSWNYRGANSIQWNGVIQVVTGGLYSFRCLRPDDRVTIIIDNITVFDLNGYASDCGAANTASQINLARGNHTVRINFCDAQTSSNRGNVNFQWLPPCQNDFSFVPKSNMYTTMALADAAITPGQNVVCTNVSQIKPLSNFLVDGFKPTYGKKMVASVWVKRGETDCRCATYNGFDIQLRDATGAVMVNLVAKSPIIEGWQLFEKEFDVPSSGTFMELFILNNTTDFVYIDDLRFHPYNSNMKSFVYNPYNLKPAAELDENNYATFYEYDDDGTLIRVKKETKLGVKTIQETRSSLQKGVTDF